eukprot:m.90513 g.90513  ORF g.90513 m.90513 type:complete len:668 (+) comp8569_c0_seq2:2-2005(+)
MDETPSEGEIVAVANDLLRLVGLQQRVRRIADVSPLLFAQIVEQMFQLDLGARGSSNDQAALQACQAAIDFVGSEVLAVDLSHISPQAIASSDAAAVFDLLEIVVELLRVMLSSSDLSSHLSGSELADSASQASDWSLSDEDDSELGDGSSSFVQAAAPSSLGGIPPQKQQLSGSIDGALSQASLSSLTASLDNSIGDDQTAVGTSEMSSSLFTQSRNSPGGGAASSSPSLLSSAGLDATPPQWLQNLRSRQQLPMRSSTATPHSSGDYGDYSDEDGSGLTDSTTTPGRLPEGSAAWSPAPSSRTPMQRSHASLLSPARSTSQAWRSPHQRHVSERSQSPVAGWISGGTSSHTHSEADWTDLRRDPRNSHRRAEVLEQVYQSVRRTPQSKAAPSPKGNSSRRRHGRQHDSQRSTLTAEPVGSASPLQRAFPALEVPADLPRHLWERESKRWDVRTRALLQSPSRRAAANPLSAALMRQEDHLRSLQKDAAHTARMRELHSSRQEEQAVKRALREHRQASARLRQYYDSFQRGQRARGMRQRTREEVVLKKMIDTSLKEYRDRVREFKKYAKEQQKARDKEQRDAIESLERYYRDQVELLDESLAEEQRQFAMSEKARERQVAQLRASLRKETERKVAEIQQQLLEDTVPAHHRQLAADDFAASLRRH